MLYINWVLNLTPFVGCLLIALKPLKKASDKKVLKEIALLSTVLAFFFSLNLWFFFNKLTSQFQFIESFNWLNEKNVAIHYEIAVDGISIFFILLTTFIFPLCILSSWEILDKLNVSSLKFYLINLLVLEFIIINAFLTTNLLLFFIFFESVLIPMLFIIGIWGPGDRKIKANYYFVFYTIAGSALLLFAILVLAFDFGSFSYIFIFEPIKIFLLDKKLQLFLWFFFFVFCG